jgi:murein DD-endopeptidase MepM/ murein hydrolase activator NlpD
MRSAFALSCQRSWLNVSFVALIAAGVSGCASERSLSGMWGSNTTTAPAQQPASDVTAAVPSGRVEATQLPPPGGATQMAGPVPEPPHQPRGRWSAQGGTTITVGAGETVDTISGRYGVPASAITQVNGVSAVQPGQQIIIPRYAYGMASAPTRAPGPVVAAKPAIPAAGGVHVVATGETLASVARRYGKTRTEIAHANRFAIDTKVRIGQRLNIPGVVQAKIQTPVGTPAKPGEKIAAAQPPQTQTLQAPKPGAKAAQKLASADPAPSINMVSPAGHISEATPPSSAAPSFRWPAHGRVISGFGARNNGQANDGINLSVPEGTSVKAAEDGVVAYAGNELKGYGNLVLVRHSNGFVTAYAHANEVLVKRGESVKRGQIIARAGQTGSVNSPQLHFEIRRGSNPVDPMQFLNGTDRISSQ